jgi:serine-aspartate repeat-containing protein C/D/E
LQGVTVTLQSEEGVSAALTLTDVTDADGEYGFTGAPVGDYTLNFDPPAGYQAIAPAQVTVTAGQTTTAPTRIAVPDEPAGPGTLYVPIIQHAP